MSFSLHNNGRAGVVCLRNTLSSTIQGVTFDPSSSGGAVIIHLDSRMKDIASSIFEKDGFASVDEGVDKIHFSCPNIEEVERFLSAFEKIEPLDGVSKKLLQEQLCNLLNLCK